MLAVNPNSGSSDDDLLDRIKKALPEAEILELTPETDLADLLGEAAGGPKPSGSPAATAPWPPQRESRWTTACHLP